MTAKPVILIVEDDELIRMLVAEILRENEFDVLEAANGGAAMVSVLKRPEIGCVFTDVRMPGELDGFTLAKYVRMIRPDCPIVLTSGHARPQPEDLDQGTCFVSKPYSGTQLLTLINSVMAGATVSKPVAYVQ
nr:response regulator [uncultured Lichenicoccus sp.]